MNPVHLKLMGNEPTSSVIRLGWKRFSHLRGWISFPLAWVLAAVLILLSFGTAGVSGQTNWPPSSPRYLFLVDASSSMSRLAGVTRQFVFDLVFTGAQGRMKAGELYDLWYFNEKVITNQFRLMNWDPALNRALASNASEFLRGVRYEKKARWDRLWSSLKPLIESGKPMTLILVSDVDAEMKGSPFDTSLNEIYRKQMREARREKVPFVTAFEARQGRLTAFVVSRPGNAIPFERLDEQVAQAFPGPANLPPTTVRDTNSPASMMPDSSHQEPPAAQQPMPQVAQPDARKEEPARHNTVTNPPMQSVSLAGEPLETELTKTNPAPVANPSKTVMVSSEITNALPPQVTNMVAPQISSPPALRPNPEERQIISESAPPSPIVVQQSLGTNFLSEDRVTTPLSPTNKETSKSEDKPAPAPAPTPELSRPQTTSPEAQTKQTKNESAPTNRPAAQQPASAGKEPAKTDLSETAVVMPLPPAPNFNPPSSTAMASSAITSASSSWFYFIVGILLLLIGLGLVWTMKSRSRPKANPSFISQSIEKELR